MPDRRSRSRLLLNPGEAMTYNELFVTMRHSFLPKQVLYVVPSLQR
jgi:hypothetical protein